MINQLTWQAVLDAIPDMLLILDDKHRIVWLNKEMLDILETTQEECLGKFCYNLIHETDQPPDYCPHTKFLNDKKEHEVETYIKKLKKNFLVTVSPIKDKDTILGAIHIARDITEVKLNELKFSIAFKHSPVGMCISHIEDGLILDVNDVWTKITGFSRDEVVGNTIKNLNFYTNLEDRANLVKKVEKVNYLENESLEFRVKDGRTVYGEMSVAVVIINNVKCWITAFIDKTETVKLKEKLKKLEDLKLLKARNSLVQSLENNVFVK